MERAYAQIESEPWQPCEIYRADSASTEHEIRSPQSRHLLEQLDYVKGLAIPEILLRQSSRVPHEGH